MIDCPQHKLDYVCVTPSCTVRGVTCMQCSRGEHYSHQLQALTVFVRETTEIEGRLQQGSLRMLEEMKIMIGGMIVRIQNEMKGMDRGYMQLLGEGNAYQVQQGIQKKYMDMENRIESKSREINIILQGLIPQAPPMMLQSPTMVMQSPTMIMQSPKPVIHSVHQAQQSPFNTGKEYRSRSPIFSDRINNSTLTPTRKQLQQRDLDVVGQYGNLSPYAKESSRNYFTRPERFGDSQKSIQNLHTQQSQQYSNQQQTLSPHSAIQQPQFQIQQPPNNSTIQQQQQPQYSQQHSPHSSMQQPSYTIQQPSQQPHQQPLQTPNQSSLNLQQSQPPKQHNEPQQSYIQKQLNDVSQSQSEILINKLDAQSRRFYEQQSQSDMSISMLSNRSITPPPVKKDSALMSPFKQERLQGFRAHEKAIKDMQLMDNDKLITCGNDGLIKMWDKYVIYAIVIYRNKGTIKMPLEGHTKAVLSIQFNQTKRILVSGSADRSVKIWKPQPTWQCVQTLVGHTDRVRTVVFVSYTMVASGGDDCQVRLWDLEQGGVCAFTLSLDGSRINRLIMNGSYLIIGAASNICTLDTITFKVIQDVQAHQNHISALQLQSENNQQALLVSAGRDMAVKLWALPEMSVLSTMREDYQPISLELSPGSTFLGVGMVGYEGEGKISIWSLRNGNVIKVHEILSNPCGCNRLQFDRLSRDDRLIIWSVHENKRVEQHLLTEL